MPRVFCPDRVFPGELFTLMGEEGHHFARVLRVREGEELAVATPHGTYLGVVEQIQAGASQVGVRIHDVLPSHESVQRVFVIQGLPKGDKVDVILQKCTEVGFSGLLLMRAQRSVVRLEANKMEAKLQRWRRIAKEAASQSQRDVVPSVLYADSAVQVKHFLESLAGSRVLLLDENEHNAGIQAQLHQHAERGSGLPIVIAVGPEGGWDDSERDWWQNELGAVAVSVGPRILRTETAGVVAVTAALYEFGQLGG